MGSGGKYAIIHVLVTPEVIHVPIEETTTTEDVCVDVARQLGIGPICRHLFSLRVSNSKIWLYASYKIHDAKSNCEFDYRLRFRIPSLNKFKKLDLKAYDYYYYQVRKDVMENKIPDISYDKFSRELLGLGVTDMYRVIVEQKVDRETIVADYKKYIPKEVVKNHSFFIKKPIHNALVKLKRIPTHDGLFIKGEYLKQFQDMAPNYLSEDFKAQTDENGTVRTIILRVNPFHNEEPGIRFCYQEKHEWYHLCSIEDLCYISVRNDGTVEISRKNGIPTYCRFTSIPLLFSFVSLLDGYYRFTAKWTFNLCKDVSTPSLKKLYSLKCHGPVGGEFSFAKLEEKRGNKVGTFILRESETVYDTYYMDVCMKQSSKPKTFKIEKIKKEDYLFEFDKEHYSSIPAIINAYRNNTTSLLNLVECLPPSEFDKSQLLVCSSVDSKMDRLSVMPLEEALLSSAPQCINVKNLQVFKGIKKESRNNMTYHYRCIWKFAPGKKLEAAMKVLKPEFRDKQLNEFLELAGKWAFLQSNAVMKLYGVTLSSPVAMVTEFFKFGPFNEYLQQNKAAMKQVDLVEAGTYLASALWHLEDSGMVHGNIRCCKLLVSAHDENTCLVKLTDPGLHKYTSKDVHWIPPECYYDFRLAKNLTSADVWAFGTTLWEIFSFGQTLPQTCNTEFYASDKKLNLPQGCPVEIYRLMLECWDLDSFRRKKPQAIMRDINQVLYQVFNSRRTHSYATAFPRTFVPGDDDRSIVGSNLSISSDTTAETFLVTDVPTGDLITLTGVGSRSDVSTSFSYDSSKWEDLSNVTTFNNPMSMQAFSPAFSEMMLNLCLSSGGATSLDSVTSIQSIFELDSGCNVVLQGRIGQGFYGEVYKGILERLDAECEPQPVAVKKLKANSLSTSLQDLEREIAIMEKLKHPNIVEIIGTIQEPDVSLIMEYVQHGSLQIYLTVHKEKLTPETLLKFASDVACGMDYLGRMNIVHRDLAARNILVVDEQHVKISDFGLAQVVGKNNYYIMKTNRDLPIKWYAPESLRDGKFSHQSDVWSYGVTLFEMFSLGENPVLPRCTDESSRTQILAALENGDRLPCPPQCPQSIYANLMAPCWKYESKERPVFAKICQDIKMFKL